MDLLSHFSLGFQVALEPTNLLLCFVGCLVGTFVGVLPGLGPAASISLLLPLTFKLPAESAIIMLAGLYYGTMYGGSTTSILINVPGEAASVVTCLDGYRMAQQGRAGPALGIAAFGSFIAGTFGTVMIMILAPPLAGIALKFGPPEFVGLVLLGLTMVTYLSSGSMAKALMMAIVGLLAQLRRHGHRDRPRAIHPGDRHDCRRIRHRPDRHGTVRDVRGPAQSRAVDRVAGGLPDQAAQPAADSPGLERFLRADRSRVRVRIPPRA